MKVFFDQLNREVILDEPPTRIVSLVPSQTELLVDLGLKDQLLGITKFCVHPEGLRREKTVVGGTKQVHLDRIKQLQPDIILCNKEENTLQMVQDLEKVAPVHVSDVFSIDGAVELIQEYGEIFETKTKASKITGEILNRSAAFQKSILDSPIRKVAYFIWQNPWMVAGKNTFIDHLLQVNKFKNAFSEGVSRYPEVTFEMLREKEVDFVLLSTEPFPFKEKHKKIFQEEVKKAAVHIVDGEYFSWYGSRLIQAFEYFRKLHEELEPS